MAVNFKPLQYEPGGSMYAPRIGEETWNLYRPQIEQLYIGHGKTLDEVMAVMADEHQFTPTESQYKIQFRRWKLRKNRVGGVPPPQKVGLASGSTNVEPSGIPDSRLNSTETQQMGAGEWDSPSMSSTSLSPQTTLRTEPSVSSIHSPSESVTSYSTDSQRTPKANAPVLAKRDFEAMALPPLQPSTPSVFTAPEGIPNAEKPLPQTPDEPLSPSEQHMAEDPQSHTPDEDLIREAQAEPPPSLTSRPTDGEDELSRLTGSLLDCLITITCDPLKMAEVNEEGAYWLNIISRHLASIQSHYDSTNSATVILQALFKYKQANVFYPNAKMSTMSVLSEIAPTTDVRDLVQQIGWLYSAKIKAAEGDQQRQRAIKANWLLARATLAGFYTRRAQASEAIKLANSSYKMLRKMHGIAPTYGLITCEHLLRAHVDYKDAHYSREFRSRIERQLNEPGTPKQLESVKYFYDHCFKLLESATVYAWSGYADFKEFSTLLEGLCGPLNWRATTLFAYFWIRWRENDTRARTLDNIARSMHVRAPDLVAAFVVLLYSRMPSENQLPPVAKLFEDAIRAVRMLSTDVDVCVPLRKAFFSCFTEYMELPGDFDPSSAAAIATRAIAMCLCDPEFSSVRELLSSEKYQRLPNAIPTLSMTPQSSISGFRLNKSSNLAPSEASMASRSIKDASVVDLPSNFMRRSWSSLGSGLLLGQRVGSLRSFYTGKSSRRTRDSKMMERTWDSDDEEDDDGDVRMLE